MIVRLQALVSVALLVVIVAMVDVRGMLVQLARLDILDALAAFVLYFLTFLVNAAKLRVLLPERSLKQLTGYTLIAQAYALLLPGQLAGEAVKAYRLGRRPETGASRAISAITLDKMTGIGGVLLLMLFGLFVTSRSMGPAMTLAALAGIGFLGGLTLLLSLEPVERMVARAVWPEATSGWRARARRAVTAFLATWRSLTRSPGLVLRSMGWAIAAQLVSVVATQILGRGLGIDLPFSAWCIVLGGLAIALVLPVTLAGLGLREASLIGLLDVFGINSETALALAVILLAIQVTFGAIGLFIDLVVLARNDQAL